MERHDLGVEPKIGVKYPPNPWNFNRVWNHYFHHPFWGSNPPIFGNIHLLFKAVLSKHLWFLISEKNKAWKGTLPETNSISPLKIGHPKSRFTFHPLIFRGELAVSFTEGGTQVGGMDDGRTL